MFHDVADHGGEALDFIDWALKVQFVVYLQDHVGGKAFFFQATAYAGHGDLDDVGGGALHGVVHGRALTKAAELWVFGLELGNMASAAIHGLGIARLLGSRHHIVEERAHARVGLVVAVDHVARLDHRDVQRLRQAVRLLTVHDAKVHGLGAAAQIGRYLGHGNAKHARGRLGMEVLTLVKGTYQMFITRKMRE